MIVTWRLVKEKRAGDAFSGEGARRYGGRWNHQGTSVVYVSGSLSLAVLELFVHLGHYERQLRFVYYKLEIPDDLNIHSVEPDILPPNWREEPPPSATKDIGTRWIDVADSAVLKVPSVIIPVEYNYALNPYHEDFQRISIEGPKPFGFDPRIWNMTIY